MVPCQALSLRVDVDLGVMAINGFSTFPKAPKHSLREVQHCKNVVGVFYIPSRQGCLTVVGNIALVGSI